MIVYALFTGQMITMIWHLKQLSNSANQISLCVSSVWAAYKGIYGFSIAHCIMQSAMMIYTSCAYLTVSLFLLVVNIDLTIIVKSMVVNYFTEMAI